jgi:tripartite-type tricarboxylate transporter receptor subunit TctC
MLKQIILLACLIPNLVFAQTVKLVVPWGPGGGNDTVARILAKHLNDVGSTKYLVENRPGAGSSLGTTHVTRSTPDGRTLLVNEITGLVFSTHEQSTPPYDWQTDLVPVAYLGTLLPMVLVVNSQSNIRTMKELTDTAKTRPLSYGSPGQGTAQHIFGSMLGEITRTQMIHVPYKAQPQVTQDLLSGQLDFVFSTQQTVLPFIESGKFTALAIVSDHSVQSIPSITSLGYPQFANRDRFFGVWAPAGTPPEAVKELRTTIHQLMHGALKEDLVKAFVISPRSVIPQDLAREQVRIANSYKQIYRDYNIKQ